MLADRWLNFVPPARLGPKLTTCPVKFGPTGLVSITASRAGHSNLCLFSLRCRLERWNLRRGAPWIGLGVASSSENFMHSILIMEAWTTHPPLCPLSSRLQSHREPHLHSHLSALNPCLPTNCGYRRRDRHFELRFICPINRQHQLPVTFMPVTVP